jgi:cyclopropane-fatty-acyl-phospholipid synthase
LFCTLGKSIVSESERKKSSQSGLKNDWFNHLCASKVFAILQKMRLGTLRVILPNGNEMFFGDLISSNNNYSAEIWITDMDFFGQVLLFGDIGLAETYMAGMWQSPNVSAVISWFLYNLDRSPVLNESRKKSRLFNLGGSINKLLHRFRSNSLQMSKLNISAHYDLGNDFFKLFLDPTLTYSSALYTKEDEDLTAAQAAKYNRLIRKMKIVKDDRVLEIGCGWGGFTLHVAKIIGCHVTAITISRKQFDHVKELVRQSHLEDLIDVQFADYREVSGNFDKIIAIEMIEAVGDNHLDTFFSKCTSLLSPHGLLGLQAITTPDNRYEVLKKNVDFIQKHIFPGSLLPSIKRMNESLSRSGDLQLYDLHDMASSYVNTLKEWQKRFNSSLDEVRDQGFDEGFVRKWNYYLSYCQAAFSMRNITVVQAIYTRPNNLILR